MSCSSRYANFEFPKGPPLTDSPVSNLKAKYLFLPYGTLLEEGELIRIWLENGRTQEVVIEEKLFVDILPNQVRLKTSHAPISWSLVAFDSGWTDLELMGFYKNELYNPNAPACLLVFSQVLVPSLNWREKLHNLLYKIRSL